MTKLFKGHNFSTLVHNTQDWPGQNEDLNNNKQKKSDHLRRLAMASTQYNIKNDTIQLKKAIKMSVCTLLLCIMLYYPLLARAQVDRTQMDVVKHPEPVQDRHL